MTAIREPARGRASRRVAATLAAGIAASLFALAPARARALEHVVTRGDTLDLLAAEYYGDRELAIYIMEANGWSFPPRRLRIGSTLVIPVSYRVRVQPGDTLASLARSLLGDARRAGYLGALNALSPGREPEVGAELLVPYNLQHRAPAPQTLAQIAALYYGDSRKGVLIGEYNFRADRPLRKHEVVDVPITNLEVRPTKAGPASEAAALASAESSLRERESQVASGLTEARRAFDSGDYVSSTDELFTLAAEGPSDEELSQIHALLAFDYAALGVPELAVRNFQAVLARHPNLALDPAAVSPKIRAALEEARRRARK